MRKLLILIGDGLAGSFRSRRAILFLFLYLGIFFVFCYGFIRVEARIVGELEGQGVNEPARTAVAGMAERVLRDRDETGIVDFLLTMPFFNTALFVLSIFATPGLILLLRYDIPAREIEDGTPRFFTFRVSRSVFLSARFLGGIAEFALITLVAHCAAIGWAAAVITGFPAGESFRAGLQFWLRLQLFFAVFIALSLLVSTAVRKPFLSLLLAAAAVLVLLIIPAWTDYLSPFDINYVGGLFAPSSLPLYRSLGACAGFSLLFFSGAVLIFRRKNL
ncbi:MAG: ABC transporter permease subunit [Candidatus Erginobacter occultus]|nr:ABC transporter permease subunit [Candidatus Erginobacter occultus]